MKYMGSKRKLAKEILPIILANRGDKWFGDLFCGGCNLLDKVTGKRFANDNNKYLIEVWKGLQSIPSHLVDLTKDISKDTYDKARDQYNGRANHGFTDFEIGWIGFMASFNGRFYGGGYSGIHGKRNYIAEQIKNTLSQRDALRDVHFFCKDYSEFDFKEEVVLYCDIPYKGTKEYDVKNKFNHDKFWNWARKTRSEGHQLFISEYSAPSDFKCIWEKEVKVAIRPDTTLEKVERLFK